MAANDSPTAQGQLSRRPRGSSLSLTDLGTVVSIVGGVAGLVYVVGGAVLGFRLRLYSLPTEAVVIQMPQWTMLTVGLTEVVLPTVAIVAAFAMYRLVLASNLGRYIFQRVWHEEGLEEPRKEGRRQLAVRIVLVLETFVTAAMTYILFALSRFDAFTGQEAPHYLPSFPLPWFQGSVLGVVVLIIAVIVVAAITSVLASSYVSSLSSPHDVKMMITIVGASTLTLLTLFAMTLPLLDVKVCRKGEAPVTGWLVATSADRLYIGQQTSIRNQKRYVESVPLSDATDVFISGNAKSTVCST